MLLLGDQCHVKEMCVCVFQTKQTKVYCCSDANHSSARIVRNSYVCCTIKCILFDDLFDLEYEWHNHVCVSAGLFTFMILA